MAVLITEHTKCKFMQMIDVCAVRALKTFNLFNALPRKHNQRANVRQPSIETKQVASIETKQAAPKAGIITEHAKRKFMQMMDICVIQALRCFDVFDALPRPDERGVTIHQLSSDTKVDVSLLEPLLAIAVSSELISLDPVNRTYRNTIDSACYRKGEASTDFFGMMFEEGLMSGVHLPEWMKSQGRFRSSREERSATHNPYTFGAGQEGSTVFDILCADTNRLQRFQRGLISMRALHPFVGFYDFGKLCLPDGDVNRTALVDIGGADGHFLSTVLDKYPVIKPEQVTLQDLHNTVELARRNGKLPPGVQYQPLNFFTSSPVRGARAYHIRACLHDYNDDTCVRILSNIAMAMAPDSKLLIAENVMDEVPRTADMARYMDCLMLLVGGRERTRHQFSRILDRAGLQLGEIYPSPVNSWAIIEATLSRRDSGTATPELFI